MKERIATPDEDWEADKQLLLRTVPGAQVERVFVDAETCAGGGAVRVSEEEAARKMWEAGYSSSGEENSGFAGGAEGGGDRDGGGGGDVTDGHGGGNNTFARRHLPYPLSRIWSGLERVLRWAGMWGKITVKRWGLAESRGLEKDLVLSSVIEVHS